MVRVLRNVAFIPLVHHRSAQRPPRPPRSPETASAWVLLILLLVPTASLAQEGTATLSGRVLDVTDGAPVSFVSVLLENADSGERLTGTLTGEDGRFLVQGLPPGEYRVSLSFPGFYAAEPICLSVS